MKSRHRKNWDKRKARPSERWRTYAEFQKLASRAIAGVRKLAEPLDAGETRKYLELVWLLLADECGLALSD